MLILAIVTNSFLGTGVERMPVSLVAGMRCMHRAIAASHLAKDSVWLANLIPLVVLQHREIESLAKVMAPWMAVAASLENLTIRLIWPL